MKPYTKIATDYAKAARADTKGRKYGKWIRLAAERFLRDLERAKSPDCSFLFDDWHACDPCDFIEKLPHVEGTWDTPNIVMHPAHVFFVVQLFGFRRRDNGNRRYTSALMATARKSAKSTIAAAIAVYCQTCENEPGAQILSAATTFPQAEIIFKIAKRMVEKTPDLREAFGLECWAKAISRMETGSSFKPIHAKASTQDGLNPSHTFLDEIHAHKTADLLNVLTSAAGARSNPLWLYTTTEGYTNPGPWGELRLFAQKLLEGVFQDTADHFLVCFWAIDDSDNEFDESKWVKANPLIDVNLHLLDAIRKEAVEAKQMPSKLAEFRIKHLNRQSATAGGWTDLLKWQACNGPVNLDWLAKYPCYGGLDLASTTDMCSFRLVWVIEGRTYTHGWRWVPESAVAYRTERGTVPYAGWVAAGLIKQTEGDTTDYAVIEQDLAEIHERFNIQQIAFDSWNARDLTNRLISADMPLIEFVQGPKSYHPAMQQLERSYIQGMFNHGGDPVLNWCASNLVARRDQNLNQAPDKKKCADKIDDMAALLMAVGISIAGVEEDDFDDFLKNPIIV